MVSRRQAAELAQGRALARPGEDAVWGWSGRAGRIRAARRAEFLIERCRLAPGVRCLELGAGTGTFTELLAESGCELVALELSPDSAERCRARIGDRVDVVVGDAQTGEGVEGSFDAIVGVSVLHHLELAPTLATMRRMLRAGGRFAFSEPNIANPQVWLERHVGWVARRRHVLAHETAFTARELARELTAAGLRVEVAEPFEFLHPETPASLVGVLRAVECFLERTPARSIAGSVRVAGTRD